MNDKGRLKEIMEIKMIQEQNKIWTRQCVGNLNSISFRRYNSWLINALDLLKKEKISICKHEYSDRFIHHCIEGGMTEIIELLSKNEIEKSRSSRENKGVIFIEQILEENREKILKWKLKKQIQQRLRKHWKIITLKASTRATYQRWATSLIPAHCFLAM